MRKFLLQCKPLLILFLLLILVLYGLGSDVSYDNVKDHNNDLAERARIKNAVAAASTFQTAAVAKDPVRVMTFNIRHGRGMDEVVDLGRIEELIRASDAVIVALQEVDRYHPRSHFIDEVRELAERLEMSWSFATSFSMGITSYGNAILSKYPILSAERISLGGNQENRSLLITEIDWDGERVTLFNTHLGLYEKEQANQLVALYEQVHTVEGPALLLGDLNMNKDNELLQPLIGKWHSPSVQAPTASGKEIDHIFLNDFFESVQAYTIPTLASDHHPVVVELQWRNN